MRETFGAFDSRCGPGLRTARSSRPRSPGPARGSTRRCAAPTAGWRAGRQGEAEAGLGRVEPDDRLERQPQILGRARQRPDHRDVGERRRVDQRMAARRGRFPSSACARTGRSNAPARGSTRRCRCRIRARRTPPPPPPPRRPRNRPGYAPCSRDCSTLRRRRDCSSASRPGSPARSSCRTRPRRAASSRCTASASVSARWPARCLVTPGRRRRPATSKLSFTVIGTPNSGGAPAREPWSSACARARARSRSRTTTALMRGFSRSTRAMK